MILLKITVTVLVVTALTLIAERAGPRVAGFLAGYPAGSAISLFFMGLELGTSFAGQSALYNITGMTAMLCFLGVYVWVSRRLNQHRFAVQAGAGITAGLSVFLLVSFVLRSLAVIPWVGVALSVTLIPLFIQLFGRIPNANITQRVVLGPRVLLIRAALAAGVIVCVTGAAHWVGPDWAGLLSAFPATVLPLTLIVHYTYGSAQAHTIIKNLPLGLYSLVIYSLTVSYAYSRCGLAVGTALAFSAATVYLFGIAVMQRVVRQYRTRKPLEIPR